MPQAGLEPGSKLQLKPLGHQGQCLIEKFIKQTFYQTVFRHNVKNKNFRHENLNLYQIYEAETIDD